MTLCTLRRVRIVAATLAVACAIAACGKREEPPAGAQAPATKPPARLTAPEPAAPPVAAPAPPAAAPTPQAAPAPAAPPPIGKVDSLEGEVRLTRGGAERAAQAGVTLEQGDGLKTGPQAWALLAMVDGATVTIRPETEMRLEAYRYVPDGNPGDNTASWSLLKGALRSITGLIGKSNPPGYQVKTPTATIGIRGTDHEPAYYPEPAPGEKTDHPPGTYDKVNSGESVLRSARGTIPVRKGQTAFANVQAQTKPQILARPPAFYQRQAEVDRRVAVRREQFHKDYEQERQKQLQVLRVQQQQKLQEAQKQRLEAAQKAQDERKAKGLEGQKQRLDAQKQQQDARKAEQDKRKAEQQKKSDQKADQKKSDQKADQKKSDQRKADEKKAREKSAGAALPPSVADRVKNMQRGDKAAPGSAARREAAPERDAQAGQKGQPQAQSQRAQPQAQSQRAQPQAQSQRAQPQGQKGQQQQQTSPLEALQQRLQPQQQQKAQTQREAQPQRAQPQQRETQQQRQQQQQQQQDRRQQQQQQRDQRKADQQGR